MGWSAAVLRGLAREYLRYLRAARGLNRKCIVLDLDNTLWGGVIGEDGLGGIQLGAEAPGNAFVAFQSELEKLWRRGILLAIASKNNPDDARAALEQHPDMLLRPSHFAAQRINWSSKAANIRELARELNIGLDSLVFLDDNPVERAQVRAELPQVLVPELPTDPADYRTCLLELGVFDTLALTAEDRQRNQQYADQRARREAESALSVDDYLADLDLVVEIELANPLNLARIAQLTNKTNQFNLTTRRYTEAEISDRLARGWRVFGARVRDRFGDNGLTGLIMLTPDWTIDTLLLSCRVMGRGVETALLAMASDEALRAGVSRLRGWFHPTDKNAPARDVYRDHGFAIADHGPDESVLWELDLHAGVPSVPVWLTVRNAAMAA
jgi:FkbH-like protein